MMIARVDGTVHGTIKHDSLGGRRLLMVQPLDLEGQATGAPLIAIDRVDAGEGETVLVMKEGGGARIVLEDDRAPVQCVVVAVVDDVRIDA